MINSQVNYLSKV